MDALMRDGLRRDLAFVPYQMPRLVEADPSDEPAQPRPKVSLKSLVHIHKRYSHLIQDLLVLHLLLCSSFQHHLLGSTEPLGTKLMCTHLHLRRHRASIHHYLLRCRWGRQRETPSTLYTSLYTSLPPDTPPNYFYLLQTRPLSGPHNNDGYTGTRARCYDVDVGLKQVSLPPLSRIYE